MQYEVNGTVVETGPNGYLIEQGDWSEALAEKMAAEDDLTLTDKHWDLLNYLRDEFFNNRENQPNTRSIVKAMQKAWGDKKVDSKSLYELFPKDPSKQGGRIAGLPESRRKGGY